MSGIFSLFGKALLLFEEIFFCEFFVGIHQVTIFVPLSVVDRSRVCHARSCQHLLDLFLGLLGGSLFGCLGRSLELLSLGLSILGVLGFERSGVFLLLLLSL